MFQNLRNICAQLYSSVLSQNVNKVAPVTKWLSEWRTENSSNESIIDI